MKKVLTVLGVLALGVVPSFAGSSYTMITYSSRSMTGFSFGSSDAYVANWNSNLAANPTPQSGYCDVTVAVLNMVRNPGLCGGVDSNISSHYQVIFNLTSAANVDFQFGVDYGGGGTALLDGSSVAYNPNDMWWGGSWGNTGSIFAFSGSLSSGLHTIDIYGNEGCCDGGTSGQYQLNGGGFTDFATGGTVPTPEPSFSGILGLGLAGLVTVVRRRKIA